MKIQLFGVVRMEKFGLAAGAKPRLLWVKRLLILVEEVLLLMEELLLLLEELVMRRHSGVVWKEKFGLGAAGGTPLRHWSRQEASHTDATGCSTSLWRKQSRGRSEFTIQNTGPSRWYPWTVLWQKTWSACLLVER